jgi:hypothetical protein
MKEFQQPAHGSSGSFEANPLPETSGLRERDLDDDGGAGL